MVELKENLNENDFRGKTIIINFSDKKNSHYNFIKKVTIYNKNDDYLAICIYQKICAKFVELQKFTSIFKTKNKIIPN